MGAALVTAPLPHRCRRSATGNRDANYLCISLAALSCSLFHRRIRHQPVTVQVGNKVFVEFGHFSPPSTRSICCKPGSPAIGQRRQSYLLHRFPVLSNQLIRRQQQQAFIPCLCDQHEVERIFVYRRQFAHRDCMLTSDGELTISADR